jgi:3-oxoacyl-[acyl-carrier protein] reductase
VDLQLAGKRALVTGGTRGIGRAIVTALAGAGASVVTCYRHDHEAAESLTRDLKSTDGNHQVVQADLRDPADVARFVEVAKTELGGLDIVVNSAGVDSHAPAAGVTVEEWRRVLDTNLTAFHLVTHAALPLLGAGASIVAVGASVSTRGLAGKAHYTASKAAINGWMRSVCKEIGPRGIRINEVAPGIIETEPGAGLPPEMYERIKANASLRRLGTPEDVANAVLLLASPLSGYVTGATLHVDGGI